MRKAICLLLVTAFVLSAGCYAGMGTMPYTPGLLWADNCKFAIGAAGGEIGSKQGEATSVSILGLVSMGDSSILAAARAEGIKKIATVDRKVQNYLGIYAKYTTIVTGE